MDVIIDVIYMKTAEMDKECWEKYEELKDKPRQFDWVDHWAKEMPNEI
ncbi:MAG: hypothetical protein GF364_12190, partial [Candidatus Lokiarchaeota archaeon]|nr:hypothetical protein [Candidatus Lokiarchaeota archaeon]